MTNLEYIKTLSAEELADLLYDYWLPKGQYVWTDSKKGLIKVLGEKHHEEAVPIVWENYIYGYKDRSSNAGFVYCAPQESVPCDWDLKDEVEK